MNMEEMINKYFRPGRLPHIWCPGCGNGVVTGRGVTGNTAKLLGRMPSSQVSAAPAVLPAILILIPFILLTAVLFRLQPALNWQSPN